MAQKHRGEHATYFGVGRRVWSDCDETIYAVYRRPLAMSIAAVEACKQFCLVYRLKKKRIWKRGLKGRFLPKGGLLG